TVQASEVEAAAGGECIYRNSPALALGLISTLALMIAQAIINSVAGCICFKKHAQPSGSNRTVSFCIKVDLNHLFIVKYNIICSGAAFNEQRGKEGKSFCGGDCYVVKPGVFTGGALLSLASVALGIIYHVALLSKTARAWDPQQNEGIAMGRVPAQATPVFVHEDTYNQPAAIPLKTILSSVGNSDCCCFWWRVDCTRIPSRICSSH
ncbi:hypothetical protein MUK42_30883, partial [Musa troglodytarum]